MSIWEGFIHPTINLESPTRSATWTTCPTRGGRRM